MRALWSDRHSGFHNVCQKVQRIRRFSYSRGLCGTSPGVLWGFCGALRGPRDFPRFFGGSDPMLVTLGNCWNFNQGPKKNPKAKESHEQHQRIFWTRFMRTNFCSFEGSCDRQRMLAIQIATIALACGSAMTLGPYPQYGGDFPEEIPEKIREDHGKSLGLFPGILLGSAAGIPQTFNSSHLRPPEHFQNSLPFSYGWERRYAAFFRSGSREVLSELLMEFPAVLRVFLNYRSEIRPSKVPKEGSRSVERVSGIPSVPKLLRK